MTGRRSRPRGGGTRTDGALGNGQRYGHSNRFRFADCSGRGRVCGDDRLRVWDRFGHRLSKDLLLDGLAFSDDRFSDDRFSNNDRLRGEILCFRLLLAQAPPTQALGILLLQLFQQRLEISDTVAMDPLPKQSINSSSVALGQGLPQGEDMGLASGLRGRRWGRALGHDRVRDRSGELAIQQRADQQEQTHRKGGQNSQTGCSRQLPIGSMQDHGRKGEVTGVGGANRLNREGKGIYGR